MKLVDICKEYMNRYDDVYNRIEKNMARFEYASYCESYLYAWEIDDAENIVIHTYCKYYGEADFKDVYIKAEYLESDEAFNKWLDAECKNRKNREKEEEIKSAKSKKEQELALKEREFALYKKLKEKYEY